MIDGRFDQHFVEAFAGDKVGEVPFRAGPTLLLASVLLCVVVAGLLLL
ncbi:MAG: hypothetical protein U1E58_01120 [Tabrizicola sp.]